MTETPIVDSHHHLWDLSRFPYRWLRPESPPRPFGDHAAIKQDYLVGDYRTHCGEARPAASVHVQANCGAARPADETAWLQSLSDASGTPTAAVGYADLTKPDVERDLAEHRRFPIARGIRMLLGWHRDPVWRFVDDPQVMESDAFRRGFGLLHRYGLSFDVVVMPEQLRQVAALATRHPETIIVIDHLGMPWLPDAAARTAWEEGMRAAAAAPNVRVKVSGLWPLDKAWAVEVLRPAVRSVVDLFGPRRCMWGSNLPIEKLMCPLDRQLAILDDILSPYTAEERDWIFRRTAVEAYRLPAGDTRRPTSSGGR